MTTRLARLALVALHAGAAPAAAAFPLGFRWGTAVAGFQTDMGDGAPDDTNADWWAWVHDAANIAAHRVSGDEPENGPAQWTHFRKDALIAARRLRNDTLRLSIEWSRVFPTSTAGVDASGGITPAVLQQRDALADQTVVAHYRSELTALRAAGLEPFVTLNHFTLPLWIHDPIAARNALALLGANDPPTLDFGPAGWLDPATATELQKYAAYVGWKFGDLVDLWAPLNEPVVVAISGYLNVPGILSGNFPPGAFNFTALITVLTNELTANALAYDALKTWDTVDADGDGTAATVGLVANLVAFHPHDPTVANDLTGAAHADYLYNRLFLNGALNGDVDANANGIVDLGEHHDDLVGKADFIGVNYYLRATVTGFGVPLTPVIPLLDFSPTIGYRTLLQPTLPPCPSTCSDFGWEIYPTGLREVLWIAGSYGRPVYITENGIADANDDQRPAYLVQHLGVLEQAIADHVADVRGYYHWSLVDNFEWASGYYPKFGLFGFDPATERRKVRVSGRDYAHIAAHDDIPSGLRRKFLAP